MHEHKAVITIGKKTVVHLQSIMSAYQEVYHHLVRKDVDGIADLAHKLSDAARQAAQTETDGTPVVTRWSTCLQAQKG